VVGWASERHLYRTSRAARQIAGRFGLPIHHAAIIAMPVTFDHFVQYGIHRHSIVPGLREVCGRDFLNQFQHHDCRQN
jgi:hypothetical protein